MDLHRGAGGAGRTLPISARTHSISGPFAYFYVCLYTCRLHDLGRSGWWQAIVWAARIGGGIALGVNMSHRDAATGADLDIWQAVAASGPALAVLIVLLVACVGFHIWLGLAKGERGDNRYGPDLGASPADVFA